MAHQNPDGSWNDEPDRSFWGYYGWDESTRAVQQTAEIVWLFSEAGFANSELVQKGLAFLAAQDWSTDGYGWETGYYLNARLLADPSDGQALELLTTGLQAGISDPLRVYELEPFALAAMRAAGFQDEAQALVACMYRSAQLLQLFHPAPSM